ncbi:class I SAM-dependent methyltransferase [Methanococcus aeolicus]|uniref:class I SAM-dependent methyltransferase n=1 Tax=Methanococcus aeolicus TaxID=42879 RepID=UPI0021C6DDF8|nr:class I SAM-dependent methyltransferase [Methanococcus aeolicus]UXM85293.1 methyltransferase domain-containing protein [Methanococcus aeolicus]
MMNDVKDEVKTYWDFRSDSYDNSPGHAGFVDIWKTVLSETFSGKKKILDVGCGTGFLSLILAELGHEVVGIDLSEGMLSKARKKADNLGLDIEFMIGDAENLPFKDVSFDAVINRHLLWTLPNPDKAIMEWGRVIKNNGKVVVMDGKWRKNSLDESLRTIFRYLAVAIHEKRNPFQNTGYKEEVAKMLPFNGGTEPENIVKLFKKANLENTSIKDLSWIKETQKKNLSLLYRLSWGSSHYYLVEGFKK